MNYINNNIDTIQTEIQNSCDIAGRNNLDVTLLAVSKTQVNEKIMQAYQYGIRDFGENKVQELLHKQEVLPKDINWHMIGHLQRNKVKYIAPFISCIHSVDSIRLANTINQEALKNDRVIDILIEVNVAEEDSKFGINIEYVEEFLNSIKNLHNIRIIGLMTIAPNTDDSEDNRSYFKLLHKKYIDISKEKSDNVSISMLSMGMSKDYKVAIEEGSTIIRIGSNLFGERDLKNSMIGVI